MNNQQRKQQERMQELKVHIDQYEQVVQDFMNRIMKVDVSLLKNIDTKQCIECLKDLTTITRVFDIIVKRNMKLDDFELAFDLAEINRYRRGFEVLIWLKSQDEYTEWKKSMEEYPNQEENDKVMEIVFEIRKNGPGQVQCQFNVIKKMYYAQQQSKSIQYDGSYEESINNNLHFQEEEVIDFIDKLTSLCDVLDEMQDDYEEYLERKNSRKIKDGLRLIWEGITGTGNGVMSIAPFNIYEFNLEMDRLRYIDQSRSKIFNYLNQYIFINKKKWEQILNVNINMDCTPFKI